MSDSRFDTRTVVAAMLGVLCLVLAPHDTLAQVQAPGDQRDRLTIEELLRDTPLSVELVHNAYFMPMEPSTDALHELSGILAVPVTDIHSVGGRFPSFRAEFFTYKGYLVPVYRDIIPGETGLPGETGKRNIILSPGRVWSEPGDDGWSRASFPFVLTGRIWNDSHNGIASFLYNESEVSDLRVQVVQEASPNKQYDGWAQLPLSYAPGPLENRHALEERFAGELALRISMRPLSDLEGDPDLLAAFDGRAQDITVSGLVIDGVLYAQPCRTRYGDFPYCRYMRHGVWSMTKSMGAALSLLRLAETYGDDVFDLKIKDYVNVTAGHDGWEQVTFGDALNMATGVGDLSHDPTSPKYTEDNTPVYWTYAGTMPAKARLRMAFAGGNYPWGPGELFRYRSIDTYILAAAMDALLKSKEGPDANLWDMMIDEVLRPIGVPHAPMMHTREPDGGRGVPIMPEGLYPTIGEMAKIAGLLQGGGVHQGRRLLSADKLRAVFPTEAEPGLPVLWDNAYGAYRYRMSFWYMPFRGEDGCFVWIPEMMGHGGNVIALMPNGMTGIRLSDAYDGSPGQYEGESMARLADDLVPFCQ